MTDSDIQAAADCVRHYREQLVTRPLSSLDKLERDAFHGSEELLVDWALSELSAREQRAHEEDLEATEEWLMTLPESSRSDFGVQLYSTEMSAMVSRFNWDGTAEMIEWRINNSTIWHCRRVTRGMVLRLLAALRGE